LLACRPNWSKWGKPVESGHFTYEDEDTTWEWVPLYIRGGSIIPFQEFGGKTTAESKKLTLQLIVAMPESGTFSGSLYLDDGESIDAELNNFTFIEFEAGDGYLESTPKVTTYKDYDTRIDVVSVIGVTSNVTGVMLNNEAYPYFELDGTTLWISFLNLDPIIPFSIHWI